MIFGAVLDQLRGLLASEAAQAAPEAGLLFFRIGFQSFLNWLVLSTLVLNIIYVKRNASDFYNKV